MTDIAADDEREAREWLQDAVSQGCLPGTALAKYGPEDDDKHRRTLLALLDRPRMPHPADVPDDVWQAVNDTFHRFAYTVPGIQAAYRALYDHYNPPPAPKKVEMWAIKSARGEPGGVFLQKSDAERCLQRSSGSRIVRLVEASDDHQ